MLKLKRECQPALWPTMQILLNVIVKLEINHLILAATFCYLLLLYYMIDCSHSYSVSTKMVYQLSQEGKS